ncbi:MAG: SagB/ThcOx family dehydrogenase [Candidatus Thorarchaeota archaeon]|nr:MAG: SagB/ThcOx family dehydrogenase [Candidatus Thorarchaeota archaeon]
MEPIILPEPVRNGGKTVMEVLQLRQTNRDIDSRDLPLQVLSNLLWAAFGVNREKTSFNKPGRTAPSASNSQEIDLYVALKDGLYLYEAIPHQLTPISAGDFRMMSGAGGASMLTSKTPVNIFYVVDLLRYDLGPTQPDRKIGDPEVQKSYYYTDTGFIAQNINLFAASEGLATWFHNCDKASIKAEFNLRPNQLILFAQTVGYPK